MENKIKLSKNVSKEIVPAEVYETDELVIQRIVDIPRAKEVAVFLEGFGRVVLWSGDDYDKKGDWTYDDIINAIKKLYE
jgi:hypothetical protein